MTSQTRQTKKSRTVNDLSDALVDLVSNQGIYAPSKTEIVKAAAESNLSPGASIAMRNLLEQEIANMLDSYWTEVCQQAGDELGLPFHHTSRAYIKRRKPVPMSEAEARQFVVVFGNGRTGKADGVRFVTADDEPDPMFLVHLQKRIDVIQKAIDTHKERVMQDLRHDAVSIPDKSRMLDRFNSTPAQLSSPA